MAKTNSAIGEMDGDVALPRSNGELVFEAPWEGRAFGLAVALNERGIYEWRAFRDQLVAEIKEHEAEGVDHLLRALAGVTRSARAGQRPHYTGRVGGENGGV